MVESLTVDYTGLWNMQASGNHGVEGLCVVDGALWAVIEHVVERDGQRYAPLATLDASREEWQASWIPLTTETGKLSALSCHKTEAAIELWMIERHYGVGRILRAEVPHEGQLAQEVHPEVVLDLEGELSALPNMEGLVWEGDTLYMVSDNQGSQISGPSYLMVWSQ